MTTVSVGEFKANFSHYLQLLENNDQEIVISFGKKRRKVAALVPYKSFERKRNPRKLGLLKKNGSFSIGPDFKIDDETLFTL